MNTRPTPPPYYPEAPPTYEESEEREHGVDSYLPHGYLGGTSAPPTQPIAARSVSYATSPSPIEKLMTKNTSLARDLNSLVRGFNNEIADFQQIFNSGNKQLIIAKADGLTRIPGYLNEKEHTGNTTRLSEATLKYQYLKMNVSDYTKWFKAINQLLENTELCCKTDTTVYLDNSAMVKFLEKLISIGTFDDPSDKDELSSIINKLNHNNTYKKYDADFVGFVTSSILTKTWDVKVFRDTLDGLLTLYEFSPSSPLVEVTKKLNGEIHAHATLLDGYCLFR